jgi:hypothetical protein
MSNVQRRMSNDDRTNFDHYGILNTNRIKSRLSTYWSATLVLICIQMGYDEGEIE